MGRILNEGHTYEYVHLHTGQPARSKEIKQRFTWEASGKMKSKARITKPGNVKSRFSSISWYTCKGRVTATTS